MIYFVFKRCELYIFCFQHRCISIFLDKKTNSPTGFALGSIEGRVAIHYVNPTNPKDNFTFKCHRSNGVTNGMQDIYAVGILSSQTSQLMPLIEKKNYVCVLIKLNQFGFK
jgi:hypothetical protein